MRIAVLDAADGSGLSAPGYFSRHTIVALQVKGHHVTVGPFDALTCQAADVVWTEWCDDEAVRASRSGLCKRLVLRLRGYEPFGTFFDRIEWSRVHAVVPESPWMQQIAVKCGLRDRLAPDTIVRVIPGGVDLGALPFKIRPNRRIAAIGRADPAKGWQLLAQWAWRVPYDIHIALARPQDAPRFVEYLRHIAPPNLHLLLGEVATAAWLEEINPGYFVTASTWETLGYTIAEAAAMGIQPLVHRFPGATVNWPAEWCWASLDDLAELVEHGRTDDSLRVRTYVEERLDARKCAADFEALLEEAVRRPAPAVAASVSVPGVAGPTPVPRILFLGRHDWANVCNRLARAFNTVAGRQVARVCTLESHPSGYREDMIITQGSHLDLLHVAHEADWIMMTGDGDYRWFGEMVKILPLADHARLGVLHVGTAYRQRWAESNVNDQAADVRFIGSDLWRLRGNGGPPAFPYFAPPNEIAAAPPALDGKIIIAHSPTHRPAKGTDDILAVLTSLQERFPDQVEVLLLENLPFEECARQRARAHIVVDQVSEIGGFGTTAVEALAAGQIVIASMQNIEREVWDYYARPPIVDVHTPAELWYSLERLVQTPSLIATCQIESLEWARRWATPEALALYWWKCLAST